VSSARKIAGSKLFLHGKRGTKLHFCLGISLLIDPKARHVHPDHASFNSVLLGRAINDLSPARIGHAGCRKFATIFLSSRQPHERLAEDGGFKLLLIQGGYDALREFDRFLRPGYVPIK